MAISQISAATPASVVIYKNTDVNATKDAVKASSAVIHSIVLDNTANAAATFFKFWNVASGSVTVGTTAPDMVIMVPASVKRSIVFFEGLTFGTALTVAAVTTAGTAGTTDPTSDAVLEIVYV